MSVKTNPVDENAEFAPHPKGPVLARCAHVISLGEKVDEWENVQRLKEVLLFLFYTGERKQNGEPFLLATKEFTNSMGEKANLRRFLESWRGQAYTPEQVKKPIDLSRLVGQPVQLTVDHVRSKSGRTYAAIVSVSPVLPQVMDSVPELPNPVPPVPQYILDRIEDYATESAAYRARIGAPVARGEEQPSGDDDLPF